MTKETKDIFTPVNKTVINQLATQVKETLAREFNNGQHRVFSSAELWHIQRNKKTVVNRKFLV